MTEAAGPGAPAAPVEDSIESLSRFSDGPGPATLDPTSPAVAPAPRPGTSVPPPVLPAGLADAILSAHLNALAREPGTGPASDQSG